MIVRLVTRCECTRLLNIQGNVNPLVIYIPLKCVAPMYYLYEPPNYLKVTERRKFVYGFMDRNIRSFIEEPEDA